MEEESEYINLKKWIRVDKSRGHVELGIMEICEIYKGMNFGNGGSLYGTNLEIVFG